MTKILEKEIFLCDYVFFSAWGLSVNSVHCWTFEWSHFSLKIGKLYQHHIIFSRIFLISFFSNTNDICFFKPQKSWISFMFLLHIFQSNFIKKFDKNYWHYLLLCPFHLFKRSCLQSFIQSIHFANVKKPKLLFLFSFYWQNYLKPQE